MSFSSQWWYLSCGAWRFACCDVLSADTGGLTLSSSGSLSGDSSREVGREGGWGGGGWEEGQGTGGLPPYLSQLWQAFVRKITRTRKTLFSRDWGLGLYERESERGEGERE